MNTTTSTLGQHRAELYIPSHLRDHYPDALAQVRENVNALTDRSWADNLTGGRLRNHVRLAIAAEKHRGIVPGRVARPAAVFVSQPVTLSNGLPSLISSDLAPETKETMTEDRKREWETWHYSQRHHEEFEEEVTAAVDAVLASPARAWETYQHLEALSLAERRRHQADRAERNERERLARDQCPLCGDSDRKRIGPVMARAVVSWAPLPMFTDGIHTLLSCARCWDLAHAMYIAGLADEQTTAGPTRAEVVRAALSRSEA